MVNRVLDNHHIVKGLEDQEWLLLVNQGLEDQWAPDSLDLEGPDRWAPDSQVLEDPGSGLDLEDRWALGSQVLEDRWDRGNQGLVNQDSQVA